MDPVPNAPTGAERVAGIDLGNFQTKCAIIDSSGNPVAVRSDRGDNSWPTALAETSGGSILIGEDAVTHGLAFPLETASSFKALLGNASKEFLNKTKTAFEVLVMFFRVIFAAIEAQCGDKLDAIVLTRPVYFTDAQTQALIDAAQSLGVRVLECVPEPVAAGYCYRNKDFASDGAVSYDFVADEGGGTFDTCILERRNGAITPIAIDGVKELGGIHYTKAIKTLLLKEVSKITGKNITEEMLTPEQNADLTERGEKAKYALSNQASTKVALNFGAKTQLVEITAKAFEDETARLDQQMLDCVDRTLGASGKTWKEIHELHLVGGPFQSRRLFNLLCTHTGLAAKSDKDPTSVVSFGAALHAFNLSRPSGRRGVISDRMLTLKSVICHDVGVSIIEEGSANRDAVCSVLVKKGTVVPAVKVERFRLERANQSDVCVEILQGPDGTEASKCLRIGVIHLKDLPPEIHRSARIEITFSFDKNTIVTVTVKDLVSGKFDTVSVDIN